MDIHLMPNTTENEITYPFPMLYGWEWMNNFILHVLMNAVTYTYVSKGGPGWYYTVQSYHYNKSNMDR